MLRATGAGAVIEANPLGELTYCTTDNWCFYRFPTGTRVTLNAAHFASGTGLALALCRVGSSPTCTVVVRGTKYVTARFTPELLFVDSSSFGGTFSGLS